MSVPPCTPYVTLTRSEPPYISLTQCGLVQLEIVLSALRVQFWRGWLVEGTGLRRWAGSGHQIEVDTAFLTPVT